MCEVTHFLKSYLTLLSCLMVVCNALILICSSCVTLYCPTVVGSVLFSSLPAYKDVWDALLMLPVMLARFDGLKGVLSCEALLEASVSLLPLTFCCVAAYYLHACRYCPSTYFLANLSWTNSVSSIILPLGVCVHTKELHYGGHFEIRRLL